MPIVRALGTMVAYGFSRGHLETDLAIAQRLGVELIELLPDWRSLPDPNEAGDRVRDAGLKVHSAHGCWGAQSIRASRVDLGHPETSLRNESVDDVKRCVDWLGSAGGQYLVVHPGGLSDPTERTLRLDALAIALSALADHAEGSGVILCVENMPLGVHPGSHMGDLRALVDEIDRPELALALDTGHAHIVSSAAAETLAAGDRLATTHVHDNDGRHDSHQPPGLGSIDWAGWLRALDTIEYRGPVMLECIRSLREHPEQIDSIFLRQLDFLRAGVPNKSE